MEALFVSEHRRSRNRGELGFLLWLEVLRDSTVHAAALHLEDLRAKPDDIRLPRLRRPRGARWDSLLADIRTALRSLRSSPGFFALATSTLALGIGTSVVMWSVVNAVLLAPLPYPDPERLVRVFETRPEIPEFALSPANFLDYREQSATAVDLAAFQRRDAEISLDGEPRRLPGMGVSAEFFRVLGIEPAVGRGFSRQDEVFGQHRVVVISERFWVERFRAQNDAIGRKLIVDGEPHTVVGVVPSRLKHVGGAFRSLPFGTTVDIWRPFVFGDDPTRYLHFLNAIGRLGDGVDAVGAHAEMDAIARRLEEMYPESNEDWRVALVPLHEEVVRATRPMVLALGGGVLVLLLIACVNVANLLLAKGASRRSEFAVRSAIGAGRRRLVSQLLTESAVLALTGGALGILLAWLGLRVLPKLVSGSLPRLDAVSLDLPMVAVALLTTILTGLAFGTIPALRLSTVTRTTPGRSTQSKGDRRLRACFVVVELTLSIILLVGAALLARTMMNLEATEPGFRAENVLTAKVALPRARYPDNADTSLFFERLVARLQVMPGVVSAGAGSDVPWSGYDENLGFGADPRPDERFGARFHFATPGYFATLGVPLVRGRTFRAGDDATTSHVVVVNERLARQVWGDENPIGRRISLPSEPKESDWREVIGVVGNIKDDPAAQASEAAIYMPYSQTQWIRELRLVIRGEGEPRQLLPELTRAVAALDPALPLSEVAELAALTQSVYAGPRLLSRLAVAFALAALCLATMGLYGLIAFVVHHERRAIAIRLAVGARTSRVIIDVLARGLRLVGLGIIAGVAGALALGEALSSLLYGVVPHDPLTFVLVTFLLSACAVAATLGPALRASRVDPIQTLRHE